MYFVLSGFVLGKICILFYLGFILGKIRILFYLGLAFVHERGMYVSV